MFAPQGVRAGGGLVSIVKKTCRSSKRKLELSYSSRNQSSNVRWVCCLLLFQPLFPVTGPFLAVHHSDNPDAIGLLAEITA
jgi:hypothetical protein